MLNVMLKKGQLSDVVKYAIIAMVIIGAQVFAWKAYTSVRDRMCRTEMDKFQIDLSELGKEIRFGEVAKKKVNVPCSADEIFFVDLAKDMPSGMFREKPIIENAVAGKADSVLIVKNGKVLRSFDAGALELEYPYHLCIAPRAGFMELFIEGKGAKTSVVPGCSEIECTEIPINPSDEDISGIIESFKDSGIPVSLSDISSEAGRFRETLSRVNMFRRYQYCPDTGITKVEIILKPKQEGVKNFRFYEYIPKECVSSLNDYLTENLGSEAQIVRDDPLIMWQFSELGEEEKLNYKLDKKLTENCKEIIEGIGIARELPAGAAGLSDANEQQQPNPGPDTLQADAQSHEDDGIVLEKGDGTLYIDKPVCSSPDCVELADSNVEVPVSRNVEKIDIDWCCRRDKGACLVQAGNEIKTGEISLECGISEGAYGKTEFDFGEGKFIDKITFTGYEQGSDDARAVGIKVKRIKIKPSKENG